MADYLLQKIQKNLSGALTHIIYNDYLYVIHSDDDESWYIIKYDQKYNKVKTITLDRTNIGIRLLYIYKDHLYILFDHTFISIIDKNDNIVNHINTGIGYIYDICIINNYIFTAVEEKFITILTIDGKFYKNIQCNDWVNKFIVIDNYLYVGDDLGYIYQISTIDFQIIKTVKHHTEMITSFICINNHLYSGGNDKTIIEWNLDLTINKKIIKLNKNIKNVSYYNNQLFITTIHGSLMKLNLNTYKSKELIEPYTHPYLISWDNKLHLYNSDKQYIKIYGNFYLRDYNELPIKTKENLWEAAKVFYMYNVSKDMRLLIYKQLLNHI
jgi:hypothetical protein